jgi:hypothetical protein
MNNKTGNVVTNNNLIILHAKTFVFFNNEMHTISVTESL